MSLGPLTYIRRSLSTLSNVKPLVCIVGSGPAGFYAAQFIAKRLEHAQIDIIEKLPVPFGLVRFGVAPDHANLKKCINQFTKTAQMKNVRFLGNIELGADVTIRQLKEAYHVVLLAYGVDDSRKFDIRGSNLKNIFQAKNFVGWYNGVPWDKDLPVDLSGSRVTIFGHGNVAIDVARILLSPIDKLKETDITEHSLAALSQSRVREVSLVGRRGPLQVSFTTKELRELLSLQDCCPIWRSEDMTGISEIVPQLVAPRKRLTELMVSKFNARGSPHPGQKHLKMLFLRSPKEFGGDTSIKWAKLHVNSLEGEDLLKKKAVETNQEETIETDLVVSSIGYKSIQADPDIPFDFVRGVVKNAHGKIENGLYTAGWLGNGASGVLAHTMENAFAVSAGILKDLDSNVLGQSKPGFEEIGSLLNKNGVQVVEWKDWLKIDEFERREGEKVNKPREKVVDVEQMLKIAAS